VIRGLRLWGLCLSYRLDIEGDALPSVKRFETGPLDGCDVNEHVTATIIGLMKP
jgi:hypothetical protein